MSKKILAAGLMTALLLAAAYIASPLHAAWSIREAIKAGDAEYLAVKIEWPRVRETLRQSMTEFADPSPASSPELASTAPRRGLWARVKSYGSRKAVENVVDSYANPEGPSSSPTAPPTERSSTVLRKKRRSPAFPVACASSGRV